MFPWLSFDSFFAALLLGAVLRQGTPLMRSCAGMLLMAMLFGACDTLGSLASGAPESLKTLVPIGAVFCILLSRALAPLAIPLLLAFDNFLMGTPALAVRDGLQSAASAALGFAVALILVGAPSRRHYVFGAR